jgi:apoptosis-inducing factor 3
MATGGSQPSGPDFGAGIVHTEIPYAGALAGHVKGKAVLLFRLDGKLQAISGSCTHYGAPLAAGLIVGDTVRCPWHHACFSLPSSLNSRTALPLTWPANAPA